MKKKIICNKSSKNYETKEKQYLLHLINRKTKKSKLEKDLNELLSKESIQKRHEKKSYSISP